MPRSITRIVTPPPPAPGFIGEGHTAVEVVTSDELAASDPFVLLMDDRLDIARRRQIGGAHPHAGLETVTLVLEGTLHDRDEGELSAGDALWMTAGRGVIHNEAVEVGGGARVLQLWIALPARDRTLAPEFEVIRRATAPVVRAGGATARLYSGTSGPLRSPTRNRVPITMVDVALEPGAAFAQDLPVDYNGFAYVLDGSAAGLAAGQVGWFAPSSIPRALGPLVLAAGDRGARVVLYAGRPIREPLVHNGPFVAGSRVEIGDQYRRFRAGEFTPMSQIATGSQP